MLKRNRGKSIKGSSVLLSVRNGIQKGSSTVQRKAQLSTSNKKMEKAKSKAPSDNRRGSKVRLGHSGVVRRTDGIRKLPSGRKSEIPEREVNINFKRQVDIYDPRENQQTISIVGLGNIGSQVGTGLGRLGLETFHLYDHDKVEEHNLSSQAFFLSDLNEYKVVAMQKKIQDLNKHSLPFIHIEKFDGKEEIEGILIIAVDSMKERIKIFNNMKKKGTFPSLVIDGRMGGPQLEVYTCRSFDEWEKTLVHGPVSNDPCGARYICYTSMIIGALISNQVKRFLKNEDIKRSIVFDINHLAIM